MSDMGDLFNALKDENKECREARLKKAESYDFSDFKKHTQWHWSRELENGRLDYWPTKNKWMYDKMYFGTPEDLINFVAKRIAR